jgi:catechol 2,3-dioxygenase-like lactoylglutathione lyase family enzyme
MSAVTHVMTVIVPVADQDAALAFYTGTLGFEVRMDGEFAPGRRWLEVAPPGAATSLALVAGDAMEVSLATTDADATHAALARAGADVDPEVMRWGGGMPPMFTFRDPDGNPLRVVEQG